MTYDNFAADFLSTKRPAIVYDAPYVKDIL